MQLTDFSPSSLRKVILDMASDRAGHLACAFSLVEIFSAIYSRNLLKFNPKNPLDPERDILALSKGHGAMALYACLYQLGWINKNEINNYFLDGSNLFGLAEDTTPGVEISGGSLGNGLPVAVGIAYGYKNKENHILCIIGDGELNEGSIWESIQFAGHHQLSNLTIIIDANKYQAMGLTKEIINLEPLDNKFISFGFEYHECNGHNIEEITDTIQHCKKSSLPTIIVARTIKGAGVDFMENDNTWHYSRLNDPDLLNKALEQINAGRIPGT